MRFFLDHDVPADVTRVLRAEGHAPVELRDVLNTQATDEEVFAYAGKHGLLMLTCSRDDFLMLAASHPNPGLIILVRRKIRQDACAHLLRLIDRAGEQGLTGNINFA